MKKVIGQVSIVVYMILAVSNVQASDNISLNEEKILISGKKVSNDIIRGVLNKKLKAEPGDVNYIEDEEILDLSIVLKTDPFKQDLEPEFLEFQMREDGEIDKIYLNNKKFDEKSLADRDSQRKLKHDKKVKAYKDKIKQKIDAFAKQNNLKKNEFTQNAINGASGTVELKLKKKDIEKFVAKNEAFISGIELTSKKQDASLEVALEATGIDPHALIGTNTQGQGRGIYIREQFTCAVDDDPNDNYTDLTGGVTGDHGERVVAVARAASPEAHVYCDVRLGQTVLGAFVENHSWSSIPFSEEYIMDDYYFDNHVYVTKQTITVAAGNQGNGTEYVTSPGKALNAITVGAYNQHQTPYKVISDSGFINSEIGNQKPELVAPGTGILGITGTSFASPHVAGFAANVMSKNFFVSWRPAIIKAILLASATDKILYSPEDKKGVGGIEFSSFLNNMSYGGWSGSNSSFSYFDHVDAVPDNGTLDLKISMTAHQKTRVVISWLNRAPYLYDYKEMSIDFNLTIRDAANNVVAQKNENNDPFEYIDFTPTQSGEYTISIARTENNDPNCEIHLGYAVSFPQGN